jgi:hypothetical protein
MTDPEISPSPIKPPRISAFNKVRMALDRDLRILLGLVVTFGGFLIFLIGCHPQIIGMDRSPLIGVVQIVAFEIGLLVGQLVSGLPFRLLIITPPIGYSSLLLLMMPFLKVL